MYFLFIDMTNFLRHQLTFNSLKQVRVGCQMPSPEEEIPGYRHIFTAVHWWRVLISQPGRADTFLMEE